MANIPFLTLLDPRARIKGSRDPLGFQVLWTKLGRNVVHNLTTVTTSLRGFSVLILGLYFAERAITEKHVPPQQQVDLFLRFEQLAAYSRVAAQNLQGMDFTEDEIRGIQRVKKNLVRRRVRISTEADWQILANQKTYGLWGLYMTAARNSGLVESEILRLTNEAHSFVTAEYDTPQYLTARDGEQILDFICADQWFEPTGKDARLARKLAGLLDTVPTRTERKFYQHHLVEGGELAIQATLWHAMQSVTRIDEPFSMNDLHALCKHTQKQGQLDLSERLTHIQVAESVFGPAIHLFNFLLARDGQTLDKIAREIGRAWGARIRTIDPEGFKRVLAGLDEQTDPPMRNRLAQLADSLAGGNYRRVLEHLIAQNQAVMQARGGSAWVSLQGQMLAVGYRENAGNLPTRDELPWLWTNTYFLNALKAIGHQVKAGAR